MEEVAHGKGKIMSEHTESMGNVFAYLSRNHRSHWIDHGRSIECVHCHAWFLKEHLYTNTFCPNCGSKMDILRTEALTVTEQIKFVMEDICMNYCKWPSTYTNDMEDCELADSSICQNCPLNRLA